MMSSHPHIRISIEVPSIMIEQLIKVLTFIMYISLSVNRRATITSEAQLSNYLMYTLFHLVKEKRKLRIS